MARIRTIKPDFSTSADTGALTREARLFFLQLLTDVDDEGRCIYVPKRLAGALYPFDDDVGAPEITQWVKECVARDMIEVYEVDARRYLRVINFEKHQRVNNPTPSKFPAPPDHSENVFSFPEEISLEVEGEMEQGTGNREAHPPAVPEPSFDDFWSVYPRKVGKPRAKAAWEKAIKRERPQRIIAAALAYAQDPNRVDSYTKHPQGWLNDDRWNDPPLPRTTRGPTRMERTLAAAAAVLGEDDDDQAGNGEGAGEARRGLPPGGGARPDRRVG